MRMVLLAVAFLTAAFAQGADYHIGSWRGRVVSYRIVNGLPVAQGDIILDRVDELEHTDSPKDPHRDASGTSVDQLRWPNRTLPYVIDPAIPNQKRVTDAIQHWNDN